MTDQPWRRSIPGWSLVAVALMVVVAFFAACGDGGDEGDGVDDRSTKTGATKVPTAAANAVAQRIANTKYPLETASGMKLGNPSAKVTMEVYEDFQCPHCLNFTSSIEPGIMQDFVTTGKVLFVFHNFPILGRESANAAIAAQCASDQGQFWPFHKKLFVIQAEANQLTDEKLNVGRFADATFKAVADELKLDRALFDACLVALATAEAVGADVRAAVAAGLRGTPGFLIDGQPLASGSPADYAGWKKLLEDKLAGR